jgi:hypothetical protein
MRNSAFYHTSDIRTIARMLGGDVVGRNAVAVPGPGHSAKDRSLVVTFNNNAPDGFVCHSHAGDSWDVCKDFVRQGLGLPCWQPGDGRDRRVQPAHIKAFDRDKVNAETEIRERTADNLVRIGRATALWNESVNPRGTPAEKYLASRALKLTDDITGAVLRYHPRCPWRDENIGQTVFVPCLIAAFTSIEDNAVVAVHRIRVDQGPRPQRRMLGLVHRAAVKLAQAGEALCIGEGIETVLAARMLGHTPSWALGSVGMISHFPLISDVKVLRILGETGEASAGAARFCGERWHAAGRRVQVVMPTVGSDLNDELMARKTA